MTDHPLPSPLLDDAAPSARPVRPASALPTTSVSTRPTERSLSLWATLDKPLLMIVGVLLSIGLIMIYSTTFYWSDTLLGGPTVKVLEQARNVAVGLVAALAMVLFDYRRVRKLAVLILLASIATLIAVLISGDDVLGARRSLIAGRLQPGEFSELAMVIYMAAWLGSKNARVRSLTYGLIPYAVLVGIVCGLVVLQPDLSTALVIFIVSGAMFFLAGADLVQITAAGALAVGAGVIAIMTGILPSYAETRLSTFTASLETITSAHPHTFQAYIAFVNGGWTGRGLGESLQKFNNALPAPHTDSIFAVIGEELGIIGAGVVVLLFVVLVARGFQIAQRAGDPFGALLASGITIWIITKALLNIAVMLSLVPPTGVVLPFISFGGSSLVTLMLGVGLLLSIQRNTVLREHAPERRVQSAAIDRSRGNGRARVPRARRSAGDTGAAARD